MITIKLPWPSHDLSPNSRAKWKRIKAVTAARDEAYLLAMQAGLKMRPGTVRMSLTFNPPSRRHFDLDGLGSRMKSAQDGVFDALGMDDHSIIELRYIRGQICKGGSVEMRIVEAK